MPEETVQAAAPVVPDPAEAIKALDAKNKELLSEKRAMSARLKDLEAKSAKTDDLEAKFQKLAELTGVDVTKDPEKIAKQRESEANAVRERASKIEKAVIRGLLSKGRKIDDDMVDLILTGAQSAKSITVDESGVTGVSEYLGKILGQIGTGEPTKDVTQESPRLPRQTGTGGIDSLYEGKSFGDLVKMGSEHVVKFAEKYPEQYEKLRQAHFLALQSPSRRTPAQAFK